MEFLVPGATLIANRAYDTTASRDLVAARGACADIPPRSIRKERTPDPEVGAERVAEHQRQGVARTLVGVVQPRRGHVDDLFILVASHL